MTDTGYVRPVPQNDPRSDSHDDVSIISFVAVLLRNRGRIVIWSIIGGLAAIVPVLAQRHHFKATAAFLPQGGQGAPSGIASLAGQFGISVSAGNATQSPEFYVELLRSRPILRALVHDTVTIAGRPTSILDVLQVEAAESRVREERGITKLATVINVSYSKTTSIVRVDAISVYPEVAFALVQRMIDETNAFNQRTRQTQAAAEAKFLDGRLKLARDNLRAAEDRLESFLQANRQIGSPELTFNRDRLQREVNLAQQVYTSLSQSYEEATVREVRDTPLISVMEAPTMPVTPEPLGRVRRTFLGLVMGGLLGVFVTLWSTIFARRREQRDREMEEFLGVIADIRRSVGRWIPWLRQRPIVE